MAGLSPQSMADTDSTHVRQVKWRLYLLVDPQRRMRLMG